MFSRVFLQRLFVAGILVVGLLLVSILVLRYQTVTILVPRGTIPAGTKIEATMLVSSQWPTNGLFEGVVTSADQIVGKTTQIELREKVPITVAALGARAAASEDLRYPALTDTEAGKLILFIRSDLSRSTGNTVVPGERITIFRLDPVSNTASVLLQRVLVVAARTESGTDLRMDARSVSLGGEGSIIPAGYLIALELNNALELMRVPDSQLLLVPENACAPFLPFGKSEQTEEEARASCGKELQKLRVSEGASGLDESGTTPQTGGATPAPIFEETPAPIATPLPEASPAPSEDLFASPEPTPSPAG